MIVYNAILPNDIEKIRLFFLLGKDIYDLFESSNVIEFVHGNKIITLKQLNKICKNRDDYSKSFIENPFVQITFKQKKMPYLLLEDLWKYIVKLDNEYICELISKTSTIQNTKSKYSK